MNKNLLALLLTSAAIFSSNAMAAYKTTLSVGYAKSNVNTNGSRLDENPTGMNGKLRMEINDDWGVMLSLTNNHYAKDYYYGQFRYATEELDYFSLLFGPSYRFNKYISAYALAGWGYGESNNSIVWANEDYSASTVAVGVGLQFNLTKSIAIDTAWEYAKLDDYKVNTWIVGLGYHF